MPIRQKYKGKRVLITGTTGFLGKVLLEKFLYSLDCVDRIYVLIRPKAGSSLHERFKKEIISSPCFDRLRQKYRGKFDQFIQEKVKPIQGDLQKEGLGFSEETLAELVEHCHTIINCAASIDFNSPLHDAIDSNIRGSLRMLELARKLKHLDVFTHISTCYVNCDLRGEIKEEIMDKGDPEEQLRMLIGMGKQKLLASTKRIIGDYPNTYTYTKSLCERLMKVRKGDVSLCIVRPAIINTSYAEPFPGWIDSIAAAAAVYLFVGLGVIKTLKGDPKKIGDIVPVDVVVNTIIVAAAYNFGNKSLPIYHVGSSQRNPLKWWEIRQHVVGFWRKNITKSQVDWPNLLISTNDYALEMRRMQRKIPLQIYQRLGPLLGKQAQRNAQRMEKVMKRGDEIAGIFQFFMMNQWIYKCEKINQLMEFLSVEQRTEFLIDAAGYDSKEYMRISNYGIQKYIVKENAELASNLISLPPHEGYFSDIRWAMSTNVPFNPKIIGQEFRAKLLTSSRVIQAMETEKQKRIQTGVGEKQAGEIMKKEAQKIINQLVGDVKVSVVRTMAWTIHKAFKNLFEKININSQMLEQLREIQKNSNIPIVLLPSHRSYLDFLVVSYIFFIYKLRLPNFVADEVLLQANLLPFLFRSSGAFFFQKLLYQKSPLYHTIFDKYLELLLCEGNTLEFFIEGSRSRTGKILTPTFQILNVVLDTVLNGKVSDACFVPLTINYEKILEADNFPGELLGQEKVAETLLRVLKATPFTPRNNGRVYVQICKPIMGKHFIESQKNIQKEPQIRHKLVDHLGREIVQRLTSGTVITSTALVSSVLLMHRKGISEEELVRFVNELVKYILKKRYLVGGVNQNSSAVAVRNAIGFLSGISKSKSNIFQLTISAGDGLQKILMLSYYRNNLVHAFLPEAFVGCALVAFGEELSSKEGVPIGRVHEQTRFLMSMLKNDYSITYSLEQPEKFSRVIREMSDDLIINSKEEKLITHPSGQRIIAFYCSLLRAHIDCHWASVVFVLSIARNHNNRFQTDSISKFYGTVQWFIESLYEQKIIEDYEACSLQSIRSSFEGLEKEKLIHIVIGGKKKESAVQVLATVEQMEDIQNRIKFFRKSLYNSVFSPLQAAKSTIRNTPRL